MLRQKFFWALSDILLHFLKILENYALLKLSLFAELFSSTSCKTHNKGIVNSNKVMY